MEMTLAVKRVSLVITSVGTLLLPQVVTRLDFASRTETSNKNSQ